MASLAAHKCIMCTAVRRVAGMYMTLSFLRRPVAVVTNQKTVTSSERALCALCQMADKSHSGIFCPSYYSLIFFHSVLFNFTAVYAWIIQTRHAGLRYKAVSGYPVILMNVYLAYKILGLFLLHPLMLVLPSLHSYKSVKLREILSFTLKHNLSKDPLLFRKCITLKYITHRQSCIGAEETEMSVLVH